MSLLTLGIYSAWAKVRRLQYFYRHTQIADACLDYHGDPVAILKGRIVAFILFGGYSFSAKLYPLVGLGFMLLLLGLTPFLLVRALRFQLHNTSYRGLRFSFHGTKAQGFVNFVLLPILSYVTLGLLLPLTRQKITHYLRSNTVYANCKLTFHGTTGEFYKMYFLTFVQMLLFVIALLAIGIALAWSKSDLYKILIVCVAVLLFIFGILFLMDNFSAKVQNYIWNNTRVGEILFLNQLSATQLYLISLANGLLIFLTLGFYKPFADIRMTRYRISCLSMISHGNLDTFIAEREKDVAATGEEIAEMFDIDIAF